MSLLLLFAGAEPVVIVGIVDLTLMSRDTDLTVDDRAATLTLVSRDTDLTVDDRDTDLTLRQRDIDLTLKDGR